jgi:hypothetical protein
MCRAPKKVLGSNLKQTTHETAEETADTRNAPGLSLEETQKTKVSSTTSRVVVGVAITCRAPGRVSGLSLEETQKTKASSTTSRVVVGVVITCRAPRRVSGSSPEGTGHETAAETVDTRGPGLSLEEAIFETVARPNNAKGAPSLSTRWTRWTKSRLDQLRTRRVDRDTPKHCQNRYGGSAVAMNEDSRHPYFFLKTCGFCMVPYFCDILGEF